MIELIIFGIVFSAILAVSMYFLTNNKQEPMSFKESSDLVGLPIVTFYIDNYKLHFLLDTGADLSIFNSSLIDFVPHDDKDKVGKLIGAFGNETNVRYADITLYYKGTAYTNEFQIGDLSSISDSIDLRVKGKPVLIAGVIGNDFFRKYKYILDFKKLVAYSTK